MIFERLLFASSPAISLHQKDNIMSCSQNQISNEFQIMVWAKYTVEWRQKWINLFKQTHLYMNSFAVTNRINIYTPIQMKKKNKFLRRKLDEKNERFHLQKGLRMISGFYEREKNTLTNPYSWKSNNGKILIIKNNEVYFEEWLQQTVYFFLATSSWTSFSTKSS